MENQYIEHVHHILHNKIEIQLFMIFFIINCLDEGFDEQNSIDDTRTEISASLLELVGNYLNCHSKLMWQTISKVFNIATTAVAVLTITQIVDKQFFYLTVLAISIRAFSLSK